MTPSRRPSTVRTPPNASAHRGATSHRGHGETRAGTDAQALARMIEVTLGGSFLAWTLHREGSAATRLREDLDATLRPYLTKK